MCTQSKINQNEERAAKILLPCRGGAQRDTVQIISETVSLCEMSLNKLEMKSILFFLNLLSRDFLLVLSLALEDTPNLGSKDNPRILCKGIYGRFVIS